MQICRKNSDKLLTFEYSKTPKERQDISDNLMRCRFMKCTEKKEDAETVIRLKSKGEFRGNNSEGASGKR